MPCNSSDLGLKQRIMPLGKSHQVQLGLLCRIFKFSSVLLIFRDYQDRSRSKTQVFSIIVVQRYWRRTSAFPLGRWSQKVFLRFQCYSKFVQVMKRSTQSFEIGMNMQITREQDVRVGSYYEQYFFTNMHYLGLNQGKNIKYIYLKQILS